MFFFPFQKWQNAIIEHIDFSSHYLKQGFSDSDLEDEEEEANVLLVGTLQDKLQVIISFLVCIIIIKWYLPNNCSGRSMYQFQKYMSVKDSHFKFFFNN